MIDVHAHFYHPASGRPDWAERNQSRLDAGQRIGVRWHVASILGSWGRTSPTYFPSPADLTVANAALRQLAAQHGVIRGYVAVNPNFTEHALHEIATGLAEGMVGIKLAASRRATDPLLDPIAAEAARRGVPILHHIWQGRRREWPGQEASDGAELAVLARRHPTVPFILAHIGGGGDWLHTLPVVSPVDNVYVDLSGSGVDAGMLERCIAAVGTGRLLWGADLTLCTGLGKYRYLERILPAADLERIAWRNAASIFPASAFGDLR